MAAAPIEVLRADEQDAEGIAALHVRAFEAAYRGTFPDVADRAPALEARSDHWHQLLSGGGEKAYTLVAEQRGRPVGFCSLAMPARDADVGEPTAEIAAFYVDPSRWRSGVGSALLEGALRELREVHEDPWRHVTLWVLAENTAARTFYARAGFEHDGVEGTDALTGRPKVRLRAPLS